MAVCMKEIFQKKVDRRIDGVIKADDEASLRSELEEYVVTDEISGKLEKFLEAYTGIDASNGVWISGFFGSGKSHLLKMLSLLLENRDVDGLKPRDIFSEKLKGRPMVSGLLGKAAGIPSRSILFNIDQKADLISKKSVDALLSVFQKVFDEACGYYGKQPYIAQFERDLDLRGQLDAFQDAFRRISGLSWEVGREQALFEFAHIDKAYAEVSGTEGEKGILDRYNQNTSISIEDFAEMVRNWLDKQGKNFRLNFLVDEVGQYIADNVKLMTNLQTIAESLNTKCRGRAWIIVTAQQELGNITGEMSRNQSNDFSKIQGRFAVRMPLNSADVAEVIQRRLLAKTDDGARDLGQIYDREENNLKTLFGFADGSMRLKNYRGRDNFISSYPFPQYQYELFQRTIETLSDHNAFEGKHNSVGERSMLGVFQTVAKLLMDQTVGKIASFDLMYEGLRDSLRSSVQQSIRYAENNQFDTFTLRVLKALFLVKYIPGFKASVRNICILLLSDFDEDQKELQRKVESSLAELEASTLIQHDGNIYAFLTSDEKDIEEDIKRLVVDSSEQMKGLDDLFSSVQGKSRLTHIATGYEYSFSKRLDGQLRGREYELSIHLLTPLRDDGRTADALKVETQSSDELVVLMPKDSQFAQDLIHFLRTDKFVRQWNADEATPARQSIVNGLRSQIGQREKTLQARFGLLLSEARYFVRGTELELHSGAASDRLSEGFQKLVDMVYTNLPMLKGMQKQESDIRQMLEQPSSQIELLGGGSDGVSEPEKEILNYLNSQKSRSIRVSAKTLCGHFSVKPYGWNEMIVCYLVAGLVVRSKIEARLDSTSLSGKDLASALTNSRKIDSLMLVPQTEYTPAQIRACRELYRELFRVAASGNDAHSLDTEWKVSLGNLKAKIAGLLAQKRDYPFLSALEPFQSLLQKLQGTSTGWYITEPVKYEDALLDANEDVFDPINAFMAGEQKKIYDSARDLLDRQGSNVDSVDPALGKKLRELLNAPDCYKGDGSRNIRATLDDLKKRIDTALPEARRNAFAAFDQVVAKIVKTPDFEALPASAQAEIRRIVSDRRSKFEHIDQIAVLVANTYTVGQALTAELMAEIARLAPAPKPKPAVAQSVTQGSAKSVTSVTPEGMEDGSSASFVPAKPVAQPPVMLDSIKVKWDAVYLSTDADVEEYMEQWKKTLLAEIHAGRKVIV